LDLSWSKSFSEEEHILSTCIDNNGDFLIIGFADKLVLNPDSITIELGNLEYFFIRKISSEGSLIWKKEIKATATALSYSDVTISPQNDIILTTLFSGEIDFDKDPSTPPMYLQGEYVILKLNKDGDFLWVKKFEYELPTGNNAAPCLKNIACDNNGNIYGIGQFWGELDVDVGENETLLTSNGESDIFIVKLNTKGDFLWGYGLGGSGIDLANEIAINETDDIFISGSFSNQINLSTNSTNNYNSINGLDIFLSRINNSGDILWSKTFGGLKDDHCSSLSFTGDGNPILLNHFEKSAYYNFTSNNIDFDTIQGESDLFIHLISKNGDLLWNKNIAVNYMNYDKAYCVETKKGNFLITGNSASIAYVQNEEVNVINSLQRSDIFFLLMDKRCGKTKKVDFISSSLFDYVADFSYSSKGELFMTSNFSNNSSPLIAFSDTLNHDMNSIIQSDGFYFKAKYESEYSISNSSSQNHISCDSFVVNNITYYRSDTVFNSIESTSGCDSLISIFFEINHSDWKDTTATSCNEFNWYDLNIKSSGTYQKIFSNEIGCDSTIQLTIEIAPEFLTEDTIKDTIICAEKPLNISIDLPFTDFIWFDGSSDSTIEIFDSGTYWYQITNICGVYSDNFEVKTKDCSAYLNIPNIFTPNNDGINDFLQPITSLNISSLYIQIYNRWGEIVFYSSDINFKWDGTKISNNKLFVMELIFGQRPFRILIPVRK
jgi:gliding motility-associated-like protein